MAYQPSGAVGLLPFVAIPTAKRKKYTYEQCMKKCKGEAGMPPDGSCYVARAAACAFLCGTMTAVSPYLDQIREYCEKATRPNCKGKFKAYARICLSIVSALEAAAP